MYNYLVIKQGKWRNESGVPMVLMLDGHSEHIAYVWINTVLFRIKFKLATNVYLKPNKLPIEIYTLAPDTGLPSNISTMVP